MPPMAAAALALDPAPDALVLDDGSRVEPRDGGVTIVAPDGAVVLSYRDGQTTVHAPDVRLTAERTLTLEAGDAVVLRAGSGGSELRLEPERTRLVSDGVEVQAQAARLVTRAATVVAQQVTTTAARIAQTAERFDLEAAQLHERTEDTFREARGLLQTRAGRWRVRITDALSIAARRTVVRSTEDTVIDGERILLG